jgi:hypothetical protein
MPVERCLGGARMAADGIDAGGRVAALRNEIDGALEQALAALSALGRQSLGEVGRLRHSGVPSSNHLIVPFVTFAERMLFVKQYLRHGLLLSTPLRNVLVRAILRLGKHRMQGFQHVSCSSHVLDPTLAKSETSSVAIRNG